MTPDTIVIINKNLMKQKNDKIKIINELMRELRKLRTQNKVYKEFSDGKISKSDLIIIIEKSERDQNEFT